MLAGFAATALTATALAGGLVLVAPATAAYADACSTTAPGVTVVVDFASLGGGIQVACAAGDPASGYDALRAAGFTTAGTQHDGPAAICRINGKPGPADEKCVLTPPASAYWSYWHAQPGGSWSFSSLGSMAHNPAPGTVEGWAFGAGAAPAMAPPRLVTPPAPPPPTPQAPPPASTAVAATTRPGGNVGVSANEVAGQSTGPAPTAADLSSPAEASATLSAAPSATVAGPVAASPADPGDPTGSIIGGAIVAVLAAAAAGWAWHRRRMRSAAGQSAPIESG